MKNDSSYSLGYSGCPNDTFIFKAIARHLIDLNSYGFNISLEDVETLNQNAEKQKYDITKLSFAAFGSLSDKYALLRTGSALGLGCGPLIISGPGRRISDKKDDKKKQIIAVPGLGTTAYHLFRFYMDDLFPGLEVQVCPMSFEKIMPSVLAKRADFGVIIHEGRFVYQNMNLELKADLGQWWEDKTSLPIPLGCIAIRRDIDTSVACDIQNLIKQSIDHAFSNPNAAYDYIKGYAQEMEESVIQQHIGLYVNDFSRDLGDKGEAAITLFFKKAQESGLMQPFNAPLFAC
ncbi:MAG: 1,4-dihydroxy-6-naphthoate synthase [Desulfobacula sp.]|nr:1,4-dihydroxy-6-naphthoate synthase [Desulfobacula sp.]